MSDLMGHKLLSAATPHVPESLREFADDEGFPEADLRMLASSSAASSPAPKNDGATSLPPSPPADLSILRTQPDTATRAERAAQWPETLSSPSMVV
jgi:hypothetical protein